MHFRKKLLVSLLLLLMSTMLTGLTFFPVELLVKGPIISLEEIVKDEPVGGGESTKKEDSKEEKKEEKPQQQHTTAPTETTPAAPNSIVIAVRDDVVTYNGLTIKNYEVLGREIEKYPSAKVIIKDNYAEYNTYTQLKNYLIDKGVAFNEEVLP